MSEIRFEQGDGWQALSSGPLRVEFRWRGDRWGHTVLLASASGWQAVVRSVEQSAEASSSHARIGGEDLPKTPALQQLHVDRMDCGLCVMGVGQSGGHHFAAAFTLQETPPRLCVDVADRIRDGDGESPITSAYELVAHRSCSADFRIEPAMQSETSFTWRPRDLGESRVCLRTQPVPDHPVAAVAVHLGKAGASRIQVKPRSPSRAGTTRRWVYGIERIDV
jgi:hypothetical protein